MADGFGSDSYSYGDSGDYSYGEGSAPPLGSGGYNGVSGPFNTGSIGDGFSLGPNSLSLSDYATGGWGNVSANPFGPVSNGKPIDAPAQEDANSFWNRAKRLLLGNAGGMLGQKLGVPSPIMSGGLAALTAPDGKKMNAAGDAFGKSIVNGLVGAIPGVGLLNTISGMLGGPTAGSMMPRGASSGMGFGESTGRGGATESLLGGLGALYGYNQASRGLNSQIGGLRGLYGQNSPYAQTLRQQLERKDAASGRRSQYGPREVELQARLAGLASGQAPMLNQLENQRTQMRTQGLGQLLQFGRQSGLFGGISNMFNGGGYTPTDSLTNDFGGNPDDFWMRGTSGD
jgi:hypothetical protein